MEVIHLGSIDSDKALYQQVRLTLRTNSVSLSSFNQELVDSYKSNFHDVISSTPLFISRDNLVSLFNEIGKSSECVGVFFHFGLSKVNFRKSRGVFGNPILIYDYRLHLTINRAMWNAVEKNVFDDRRGFNIVQKLYNNPISKSLRQMSWYNYILPKINSTFNSNTAILSQWTKTISNATILSDFEVAPFNQEVVNSFINYFISPKFRGFFIGYSDGRNGIKKIQDELNANLNYAGMIIRFFCDDTDSTGDQIRIGMTFVDSTDNIDGTKTLSEIVNPVFTSFLPSIGDTTPPNGIPQIPQG